MHSVVVEWKVLYIYVKSLCSNVSLFYKKIIYFYFYLFLAVLGLCCCAWAFSSCVKQGLLFVAMHGLLIVVASLVVEHGL